MSLKPKRKTNTQQTHNPKTRIENRPHLIYGQAYVRVKSGVAPMTIEEVTTLLSKKCPKTMRDALWDKRVYERPTFFLVEVSSNRYTRTLSTEVLRIFPNATVRLATHMEKHGSPITHLVVIPKEATE